MESSANVTLRAVVMLVFLVAVPLVAALGTSFPMRLVEGFQRFWKPGTQVTVRAETTAGSRPGDGVLGGFGLHHTDAEPTEPPARPVSDRSTPAADSAPSWGAGAPPTSAEPQRGQRAKYDASAATGGLASQGSVRPLATPRLPRRDQVSPAPTAQFAEIEHQLRQLGATYYVLEGWGPSGDRYRFHCRVATGDQATPTQQFDATDRDPVRAMQAVLVQVEQWQARQAPARAGAPRAATIRPRAEF